MKLKLFIAGSCLIVPSLMAEETKTDFLHTNIACFQRYVDQELKLSKAYPFLLQIEKLAKTLFNMPVVSEVLQGHDKEILAAIDSIKSQFISSNPEAVCNEETYQKFLTDLNKVTEMITKTVTPLVTNFIKQETFNQLFKNPLSTIQEHLKNELKKLKNLKNKKTEL